MTLRRRRAHPETSMEITDGETWQHREIADQTKDVEELYARHETIERLEQSAVYNQLFEMSLRFINRMMVR
jgi:RNA polymerase sigma-70 factor (ECF subfamily)